MGKLDGVDLTVKLHRKCGRKRLKRAQRRLLALRLQAGGQIGGTGVGPPLAIVFEGWDASGKGGAIRRLTAPPDRRHVTVAEFAAPSDREKRHHFLWRFWPVLPGRGGMSVFDRSWYGRVLVERVEGFATKAEWSRAYDQIVEFERGLCAEGMVLVKFWMHISEEEQLRRFQARQKIPLKSWKLTEEDWRNREKHKLYVRAVEDMLRHTDHAAAPWHVIPGDSKRYARVAVIETVISALEQGLRDAGHEPIALDAEPDA